jgi:hypothetical protein
VEDVAGSGVREGDPELALAVVECATYREAGERCGVSERTVQRRMGEEDFRRLVAETERDLVRAGVRRLSGAQAQAASTLIELTGEEAAGRAGASVRLRAAMAILQLGAELGQVEALAEDVAALMRAVNLDPRTGQAVRAA